MHVCGLKGREIQRQWNEVGKGKEECVFFACEKAKKVEESRKEEKSKKICGEEEELGRCTEKVMGKGG